MGESTHCQALAVSQVAGVFCNNLLNRRGFSGIYGGRANSLAAKEVHEPPECSGASLPYNQSVRETTKKLPHMVIGHQLNGNRLGLKPAAEVSGDPNLSTDKKLFESLGVERLREGIKIPNQWTFRLPRQRPQSVAHLSSFRLSFQMLEGARLCRV